MIWGCYFSLQGFCPHYDSQCVESALGGNSHHPIDCLFSCASALTCKSHVSWPTYESLFLPQIFFFKCRVIATSYLRVQIFFPSKLQVYNCSQLFVIKLAIVSLHLAILTFFLRILSLNLVINNLQLWYILRYKLEIMREISKVWVHNSHLQVYISQLIIQNCTK